MKRRWNTYRIQILSNVFIFLIYFFIGHYQTAYATDSTTTTIISSEDTYVDSANPLINKNTSTTMWVDASPSIKRGLIRFNLSSLPAGFIVNSATLKLFVSTSDGSSVSGNVDQVLGPWNGNTVTYSNSPAVGPLIAAFPNPGSPGTTVSADVTSFVINKTVVDFYITTPNSDGLLYYSRENGLIEVPELIVTWSPGNSTPSPSPTVTLSPTPISSPTITISPSPTPTPIGSDPIITAAGDIACGSTSVGGACKQAATANLITQLNPNAVLVLGDNQYENGSLADFQNFYNLTWGIFKSKTFPVLGNHEYLTTGATGYFDYFNGVGVQVGIAGDRMKGYYSYNLGSWHLVALNSNCTGAGGCSANSPQGVWLKQDLIAHPNLCTLAYFHHPLYSSGGRATTAVASLWQILYDNNADLILVGHDHTYERFAPQDANSNLDVTRGIREFVVGTGGRNHTSKVLNALNSQVFDSSSFGVLKVTLHPTNYDWNFVPIVGATFTDSGTQLCH